MIYSYFQFHEYFNTICFQLVYFHEFKYLINDIYMKINLLTYSLLKISTPRVWLYKHLNGIVETRKKENVFIYIFVKIFFF